MIGKVELFLTLIDRFVSNYGTTGGTVCDLPVVVLLYFNVSHNDGTLKA